MWGKCEEDCCDVLTSNTIIFGIAKTKSLAVFTLPHANIPTMCNFNNVLVFLNILTHQHVEMKIEDIAHIQFVNKDATLAARKKKLYRGHVMDIFGKRLDEAHALRNAVMIRYNVNKISYIIHHMLYTVIDFIIHEHNVDVSRCINTWIHTAWFTNTLYTQCTQAHVQGWQ